MRNFEIAVRGPFDIADRMYMSTQISSARINMSPTSPVIRPSSPNSTVNIMYGGGNLIHSATLMRKNSINHNFNPNHNYQPSHFGLDSVYGDENYSVNGSNRVLLNPAREDQCWDILFMVCGGTGLTPMLQLVCYLIAKQFLIF